MTREEEIQLVKQWQQNDKDAAGKLYIHIVDEIRGILISKASCFSVPLDEVDDVTQKTFVVLNQKVLSGQYHPEGIARIKTFTLRIAINILMNDRRWTIISPDADPVSLIISPVDDMMHAELRRALIQSIKEMDETDRFIFCSRNGLEIHQSRVCFIESLNNSEIAEKLNYSRAWVSARYCEIKIKLQKKLSDFK